MMRNKNVRVFLILLALVCVGALGYYLFTQLSTEKSSYDPTELTRLIQEGTIEACDRAHSEASRFSCISKYMTFTEDFNPAYCQGISEDANPRTHVYVPDVFVPPQSDISINQDDLFFEVTSEDRCRLFVAENTLEVDVCASMSDTQIEAQCVSLVDTLTDINEYETSRLPNVEEQPVQ